MSATLIAAGVNLVGGLIGGGSARRARRRAERAMRDQQRRLDQVLANRQAIINPYAGVTDLSGLISNPFANLQVATGAAEMQAEEADLSLASTLDTLRATGAGAGGATALAQEAARSKRGVAASIGQQEAQNERLRAQGEAQAQQRRIAEQQRLQSAQALGAAYQFEAQEARSIADISRLSGMVQQSGQQAMDAAAAQGNILGSAFGNIANIAAAGITGQANINDANSLGGGNPFSNYQVPDFSLEPLD
tara:strand:- start:6780 stop:7526 length:747 start_codon:yes stop_codon:yes gene_type:complete